jgi:hypothetical protein
MIKSESILTMYRELSQSLQYKDHKFICFNDIRDYDNPNTQVVNWLVKSISDTHFPIPSSFEKEYDPKIHFYAGEWTHETKVFMYHKNVLINLHKFIVKNYNDVFALYKEFILPNEEAERIYYSQ